MVMVVRTYLITALTIMATVVRTYLISALTFMAMVVRTYLLAKQYVEGEAERHDEDGEDTHCLKQGPQNLQEHHHIDPEKIKPARTHS